MQEPSPTEQDTTDLELVRACADGDQMAFGELYDRHGRRIYSLAMRMLRDEGRAAEATQDVFVAVWQMADRFDPMRAGVATWIGTIAHSRIVDTMRKARTTSVEQPTDFEDSGIASTVASPDATDRSAMQTLVGGDVRSALAVLPPKQREAIELAYFSGLSHTEIAERIDEPIGTVKTRVFYGLRRLREALEELQFDGSEA